MKTNLIKLMSTALAALAVTMVFISCNEDDESSKKSSSAGLFSIKNISTGYLYDDTTMIIASKNGMTVRYSSEVKRGDTLVVEFTPEKNYANFIFTKTCKVQNKSTGEQITIEDTLFTDKLHMGEYTIDLQAYYNFDGYDLSAKDATTITIPATLIKDDEAGTFTVWNLSTNKELTEQEAYAGYGDSLRIKFSPKEQYSHLDFRTVYNEPFNKEWKGQTDFTFFEDWISMGYSQQLGMTALYDGEQEDTIFNLYAYRKIDISSPNNFAYITYNCMVRYDDLLTFVTPELVYVDNDGFEQVFELTALEDDYAIEYNSVRWNKSYRFDNRNEISVSLRFIPKGNFVLNKDSYNLWCGLSAFIESMNWNRKLYSFSGTAQGKASISYLNIPKKDIPMYIEHITANPLSINLHIDDEGSITQEK